MPKKDKVLGDGAVGEVVGAPVEAAPVEALDLSKPEVAVEAVEAPVAAPVEAPVAPDVVAPVVEPPPETKSPSSPPVPVSAVVVDVELLGGKKVVSKSLYNGGSNPALKGFVSVLLSDGTSTLLSEDEMEEYHLEMPSA